ncbi:DNA-binding transcriptional regulator YiaG, partial [Streptomyces eurocidicus]|nr:DNA-binding transcriptional regulator YiaG [Streptomyces eurocidicus]
MSPTRSNLGNGTLTTGRRSRNRAAEGLVTGHLFKVIRERLPCTQSQLGECLGVDTTTVQGWESGRRPVAAMPAAQFLMLRRRFLGLGADPGLLVLLDAAMDADSVIARALCYDHAHEELESHPLAGWVFTRASTHMIAWALTGIPPAALPPAPSGTPRRRGPSPETPMLTEAERRRFYSHMRRYTEIADHAGEVGALLRRQALYLCSYDTAPDTHAWLADIRARKTVQLVHSAWSPAWADTRSLATSLTKYGDLDVLHGFIERGMGDDAGEVANLNYWAHWLGLDRTPRSDDSFMSDRSTHHWDARALLRGFADRLDPGLGCVDLNIHSVWSLIASRPGVLAGEAELAQELRDRVSRLLDSGSVSRQSRRELDAVHYGLRDRRESTCLLDLGLGGAGSEERRDVGGCAESGGGGVDVMAVRFQEGADFLVCAADGHGGDTEKLTEEVHGGELALVEHGGQDPVGWSELGFGSC